MAKNVYRMNFFRFRKLKQEIVPLLNRGAIGVLPTDTLYGLVGQALRPDVVERIYAVRRRNPEKPCIILISSMRDLALFEIELSLLQKKSLQEIWPGPVSVVLDCKQEKFNYLHRGANSLAFRLPKARWLQKLLALTGPLIAPSANPEGALPATTISSAKAYFGEEVDFYVDFGELSSTPSTVIRLEKNGQSSVLRAKINLS